MRCALGFVTHTGRAVAVAVGAGQRGPEILDRRRFEVISGGFEVGAVYHVCRALPLADAQRKVEGVRSEASKRAGEAVSLLVSQLRLKGHEPGACAIVGARKRAVPPDLATILRSHALIHAAEGDLYRAAVAAGVEANGMDAITVPAQDLDIRSGLLRDLGRGAGPPWARDQKLAALAALLLLGGIPPGATRRRLPSPRPRGRRDPPASPAASR
ncbi:MAG: hypothetical protein ACXWLR_14105, partial [Myxococcales bacterium]